MPEGLKPGIWLTAVKKLERGIWPWTVGVRSRLPMHYKRRFVEKHMKEPLPVHFRKEDAKWKLDSWGQRVRVINTPIPIKYPEQADQGLWGGEGFVEGLRKKKDNRQKPSIPRIWMPHVTVRAFYSEILDKHMKIAVTRRTLDQIDECFGFDFYILKTHEVDLKSKLGMKLKREMMETLSKKSMHPNDPDKRDEIYARYKEFLIPEEEIEWLGLTIEEAEMKQEQQEEEQRLTQAPMKHSILEEFLNRLEESKNNLEEEKDSRSILSKLNPFRDEDYSAGQHKAKGKET